jgi:hypothetical protein
MVSRRTAYWINYFSRSPFDWLGGDALRRSLLVQTRLDQFGTIIVTNGAMRRDLDVPFAQATRAALEMIQRYDPRRFRVMEREVRLIVNQSLVSGASYDRSIRQCKIDFARYWVDADGHLCTDPKAEDYEWYLSRYASTLVHEATHGRLDSLHFAFTKNTRLRIERICVSEQRRFLAHLPQDRYDFETMVSPFNPQKWEAHWRLGRRKRILLLLKRQIENLKSR